jgi:carbonic anhydrase
VERAKKKNLGEVETLNEAIQENVRQQMHILMNESHLLRELVEARKVWIVGGTYSLQSGKVNLLYAGATSSGGHAETEKS